MVHVQACQLLFTSWHMQLNEGRNAFGFYFIQHDQHVWSNLLVGNKAAQLAVHVL